MGRNSAALAEDYDRGITKSRAAGSLSRPNEGIARRRFFRHGGFDGGRKSRRPESGVCATSATVSAPDAPAETNCIAYVIESLDVTRFFRNELRAVRARF